MVLDELFADRVVHEITREEVHFGVSSSFDHLFGVLCIGFFFGEVGDGDACGAFASKADGGGTSDTTVTSGDECNFAFEPGVMLTA